MRLLKPVWLKLGLMFYLLSSAPAMAAEKADPIADILTMKEAPSGVVFEIASSDAQALRWAVPRIESYVQRLRERFPGLDVAVVSHGKEQFALTRENQDSEQKIHQGVQRLSKDQSVSVHICETYASWHSVDASEFPDYIQVSATGPMQVNDYKDLGYVLVRLRRP